MTLGTTSGIRSADYGDLARLVELNNAAVPAVNHLTVDKMEWFLEVAHRFLVAEASDDGTVVALLVGLDGPGCSYDSSYYAFFCNRYEQFLYVDRVVVDPAAWGRGLGQAFYRAFASSADGHTHLCAEVNTMPRNDRSLAFHARYGFEAVGEQSDEATAKAVRMFALAL